MLEAGGGGGGGGGRAGGGGVVATGFGEDFGAAAFGYAASLYIQRPLEMASYLQ